MKKFIKYTAVAVTATLLLSCNAFLDKLPDARTELDTDDKIGELLVNAYPTNTYAGFAEHMSDNIDYRGPNVGAIRDRMQERAHLWEENLEGSLWDDPKHFWEASYKAIAHANEALKYIEEEGNPARLDAQRGEALLCRAFAHFYLANIFCQTYHPSTSTTNLGIPYIEEPETTVIPHYDRETLEKTYEKIERDLLLGIPLIFDNAYAAPKFHFTRQAAYAFAARFYQFKGDYDKVIEYANIVLGADAASALMDYSGITSVTAEYAPIAQYMTGTEHKANIMFLTPTTSCPIYFGNYSNGKRYSHCERLAKAEGYMSNGLWGTYATTTFWNRALNYTTWVSKPEMPYYFNYTNLIARTGHVKTTFRIFTTNETLLARAEAYALLGELDAAAADISLWMQNNVRSGLTTNKTAIHNYYSSLPYYEWNDPTPRKKINMNPAIEEGSELESILQCLLHVRRIEYGHNGMRWFDIKRFGIEIVARELNANQEPVVAMDVLRVDDPRRAVQLPPDVIDAGLQANPRKP